MLKGYGAFWKTKNICPPLIRYKTQTCQSWSCSMRSWARISGHGFRPQFPAANDVNIVFSSLRSCDNSEVTPKRCDWDLLARQLSLRCYIRVFTHIMLKPAQYMSYEIEKWSAQKRANKFLTQGVEEKGGLCTIRIFARNASDTGHLESERARMSNNAKCIIMLSV